MRWTLRIAVALGAAFLALTAIFLLSLVAVPVLPRTLGLSEPVRRALRPHLPVPPTRRGPGLSFPLPSPAARRAHPHGAGPGPPPPPRARAPSPAPPPPLPPPLGPPPPYRHAR